ncbi:MAG: ribose-phosphate pyrophosphokinase [Armatimonadetes bacterium]|nr:ribose-phosphate pyrophosphokinase [Armatimonadota bacterium]
MENHHDQNKQDKDRMRIFTGNANPLLAQKIAEHLGGRLGQILVSRFSDGEIRVQVGENARGLDVFIVQPTCAPVNENLMELLIMLDAFRRASARRITCVIPYYGYARQDKKVKPREPITARLVANLLEVAGANRILTVDLHAQQIQGFFNLPVDHLYAGPKIGEYLIKAGLVHENCVVVSPDVAGTPRAKALAEMLGLPFAIIAKRRPEPNKVEVMEVVGNVEGKTAIMIDDMVDTGGSLVQGAEALIERGATDVIACCTHPVLSGNAPERILHSPIRQLVVTDTIPVPPDKMNEKIVVLSVAELLADAIWRIHKDDSVSVIFERQAEMVRMRNS